jgi:hypothetical protein
MEIRIAGRLTKEACIFLDDVVRETASGRIATRVDLAGIRLVDRASVEYLAGLRRRGVLLVNLPPYVDRWVAQIPQPGSEQNIQKREDKI